MKGREESQRQTERLVQTGEKRWKLESRSLVGRKVVGAGQEQPDLGGQADLRRGALPGGQRGLGSVGLE